MLNLLSRVYATTSYTNPLHPEVFPGICKMEAEVVRITANLFHGGPESCGCVSKILLLWKVQFCLNNL